MTKYVVRKLDFGYLVNIKKKILYLNQFNRNIRFKDRSGLLFKRKTKFYLNRSSVASRFKNSTCLKFNNVLNKIKILKLNGRFFNQAIQGLSFRIKPIIFKVKRIFINLVKFSFKINLNLFIKKKVKKFIEKRRKNIRKFLRKIVSYFEYVHNSRFRSKFTRLDINYKISKKIRRKFYKFKGFSDSKSLLDLRKQSLYNKNVHSISLNHDFLKYFSNKLNNRKFNNKSSIKFDRINKLSNSNKKPTQREKRKKVFFSLIRESKKGNVNFNSRLLLNAALRNISQCNLNNSVNLSKYKLASGRSFNLFFSKLKVLSRASSSYFRGTSVFSKLIKVLNPSSNLMKNLNFNTSSFFNSTYIMLRERKLRIKYYVSKSYTVSNKYIKNIKRFDKNLNIFFNINIENMANYSNVYNKSLWVKFFFNFIYFFFFKYCNIKSITKKKLTKGKQFRNNLNFFSLDRPSLRTNIKNIFETQNSFFFFRFIRISKKVLDLFAPIKSRFMSKVDISSLRNVNNFYYIFLIKNLKFSLISELYNASFVSNKLSIINSFFFLILCNALLNKKFFLVNKLC